MFSLEWWISVVVAGGVVSIFAAYVVRWLDRGGGAAIQWLGALTSQRRAARRARIEAAGADDATLNRLRMKALRIRLEGLTWFAMTILLFGFWGLVAVSTVIAPERFGETPVVVMRRAALAFASYLLFFGAFRFLQASSVDAEATEAELLRPPAPSN